MFPPLKSPEIHSNLFAALRAKQLASQVAGL
jgi:hypothetical protein